MIWNDRKIRRWAECGWISPFDNEMINPTSIDLKLGNSYRKPISDGWSEPIYFEEILIKPGDFLLCHSLEFTSIPFDAVAFLYLKSSMGRKGIEHLHAGFGDAGFSGQWTFEITSLFPSDIILKAGQPICQLIFLDCHEPETSYNGHYQNQTGATIAWDD